MSSPGPTIGSLVFSDWVTVSIKTYSSLTPQLVKVNKTTGMDYLNDFDSLVLVLHKLMVFVRVAHPSVVRARVMSNQQANDCL